MSTKKIEARAQELRQKIGEFHEDLIQDNETAYVVFPALWAGVGADGNDVTVTAKFGVGE
jgi:hypothetical protein